MTEKILYTLLKNGYKEMISRGEETGYRIFYDMTASIINAVIFVDAATYTLDFHEKFNETFKTGMKGRNLSANDMLVLCVNSNGPTITEQMSVAHQVCAMNAKAWIYDEDSESLYIYENQVEEFYGLKRLLEGATNVTEEELNAARIPAPEATDPLTFKERMKLFYKALPKATSAIILINVLVFILCEVSDYVVYFHYGSVGLKLITDWGQTYRIFTSMFLHLNMMHLFSNMLLLFFTGEIVEKETKPVMFLVIYFLSGILGCISMFAYDIIGGHDSIMIGASGAVYGILGALLALVIFKRFNNGYTRLPRVCFAIFISIFSGFGKENIANWAHIGGLVAGFLVCVLFCIVTKNKHTRVENED